MFNPEASVNDTERAQLAQLIAMPGYRVLHKIMRAEVDKFILALINTTAGDDLAVLAAHKLSKAAAQYFTAVIGRVNGEAAIYQNMPRDGDQPQDATEGIIDLGERAVEEPTFGSILEEMNAREL